MNTRAIPKKSAAVTDGMDMADSSPVLGGLEVSEQLTVTTIPVTGDLTDETVPNGLSDEPVVEE
jgi:hypothetical protein